MEQYLKALKNREEVEQEVLEELAERFKEPEPEPVIPEPTEIELLKAHVKAQDAVLQEVIFEILPMFMGV